MGQESKNSSGGHLKNSVATSNNPNQSKMTTCFNLNCSDNRLSSNYQANENNFSNQILIESGYIECPFHLIRTQWYNLINYFI